MNIFLVPYTLARHFSVGIFCAGAGMLAWWVVLFWVVSVGPLWGPSWDGAILLTTVAVAVSAASVMAESLLRRRAPWRTFLLMLASVAITLPLALFTCKLWDGLLAPGILGPLVAFSIDQLGIFTHTHLGQEATGSQLQLLVENARPDSADPSLVSLRYRLGAFVLVGLVAPLGPLITRKFRGALAHMGAGLAAGLLAAAAWHMFNSVATSDLYLAGSVAALTWGLVFGLFAWGLPDELYAGWLRVLTPHRFGHRIPVDAPDGSPKERFVGHFPRGLDVFLPAEAGAAEMHLSVAVGSRQRYVARGLTLAPTTVRRFLERVDLRYDPRRPAPLETVIGSGDRIVLGDGPEASELEFIMLPREER